jgi:hypothetical protein
LQAFGVYVLSADGSGTSSDIGVTIDASTAALELSTGVETLFVSTGYACMLTKMTHLESVGTGSRFIAYETSLETGRAETKSLLSELPLPGTITGLRKETIQIDSVVGSSSGTCSETGGIGDYSVASTCASTGLGVDDGINGTCYPSTSSQTIGDRGDGTTLRTDGGASESISESASPEVEVGIDTDSLGISQVHIRPPIVKEKYSLRNRGFHRYRPLQRR